MKTGTKTLEIMSTATWYNNWLLNQISKYLKGEILEVGAGIGNFTSKLTSYGNVTAIDYDPDYVNVEYGDIEKAKYSFKKKMFDTIVCMNVLEHIKDDRQALKNMHFLLRKGGKLILLVPAHMSVYGPMDKALGHFRRYNMQNAETKIKMAGFKVIKNKYLNWLGLLGWYINGKIFKKKIIPQGQLALFDKISRIFLMIEKIFIPPFGLSVLIIGEK